MHILYTSFYVTQFMGRVIVVSVGSHYKLNTTICCSLYCVAIFQLCRQLPHTSCVLLSLESSF